MQTHNLTLETFNTEGFSTIKQKIDEDKIFKEEIDKIWHYLDYMLEQYSRIELHQDDSYDDCFYGSTYEQEQTVKEVYSLDSNDYIKDSKENIQSILTTYPLVHDKIKKAKDVTELRSILVELKGKIENKILSLNKKLNIKKNKLRVEVIKCLGGDRTKLKEYTKEVERIVSIYFEHYHPEDKLYIGRILQAIDIPL